MQFCHSFHFTYVCDSVYTIAGIDETLKTENMISSQHVRGLLKKFCKNIFLLLVIYCRIL
jgi:hypothetical protein